MHSFTVLNANDLSNRVPNVRKTYTKSNPARLHLISILEAINNSLQAIDKTELQVSETQLQSLLFAAWISCSSSIEKNKGRIESLGTLHHILSTQLEIPNLDKMDDFVKLTYLTQLYDFIKNNRKEFEVNFICCNTTSNAFCDELLSIMRSLLQKASNKTNSSLKAIPNETALDLKMQSLPDDYETYITEKAKAAYIKTNHDPNHKFLATLIAAISQLLSQDETTNDKSFLSRSERIKIGAILYTMRLIYNGYVVRSAHNAGLYDLCYKMLNDNDLENIDPHIQGACIAAFMNFLDANNIKKLERIMNCGYIDLPIITIKEEAAKMIKTLTQKPALTASTVTLSAAAIGGLLASAPGYGVGYTIGYIASEMNNTLQTKVRVSQLTGQAITVMFGSSGQCMGYFVSNMVVDVVLERAFAKIFELFGILLGAGVGAGMGIIIYDFSYKTLRDLCKCYLTLQPSIEPNLARNIDPKILNCLLALPQEVFEDDKKDRLRAITQQGLFQQKIITQNENVALNSASEENSDALLKTLTQ